MRLEGRTALAGVLAAATLAGCTHRLMDFTVMSSRGVDLSRMASFERGAGRLRGEDRSYIILFIPTGLPQVEEAIDRAIEQVPGAVALVDGTVYQTSVWFIVFGWNSYVVEGTPLVDPALIRSGEAPRSDFMVSYVDPATREARLVYLDRAEFEQVRRAIRSNDAAEVQRIVAAR